MLDMKNQLQVVGVEDVYRMFQRAPRYSFEIGLRLASLGNLQFLLRNTMVRHTQKQLYRGTNTTLMSLPPRTERSVEIALSGAERKEYDALEAAARNFYVQFKTGHSRDVSNNFLLLSQKLTPQRVAFAGGHPPLNAKAGNVEENDNDGEAQPRQKKEIKLSDFCFTSKLMALIYELKRAHDTDPTSKVLGVYAVQYDSRLAEERTSKPRLSVSDVVGEHDDEATCKGVA